MSRLCFYTRDFMVARVYGRTLCVVAVKMLNAFSSAQNTLSVWQLKKTQKKPQFNTWAIDRKEKQASLWASVSGRLMKPRRSHHCVKGSFCLLCDTTTHPENDCHPLIDLMAKWSAWLVLHRSEASRCTLWHFLPYFILCFCISSSLYLSLRLCPTSPPNTPKTP